MNYPIRACYNLPWGADVNVQPDGSMKATGLGSEIMNSAIDVFNSMFKIKHFNYSIHGLDCFNSLMKNTSDISTYFSPITTETKFAIVPVVTMVNKIVMITGYNVTEYKLPGDEDEIENAMSNFNNFHWEVYLLFIIFFIIQMTLIIIWRFTIQTENKKKKIKINKIIIIIKRYMINRNDKFKIIILLNWLVIFFISNLFIILYKTNSIIPEAPEIFNTQKEVLNDPIALPVFYDIFVSVSQDFKNSLPGSTLSKLWIKANNLTNNQTNKFIEKQTKSLNFQRYYSRYSGIVSKKYVLFTTELVAQLNKNFGCSFSNENELWKMVKRSEKNELESLHGIAIRKEYLYKELIVSRIRRGVETHLFDIFFKFASKAAKEMAYRLQFKSPKHTYEQKSLCDDDSVSRETVKDVAGLSFKFYKSFGSVLIFCLISSFIVIIFEIIMKKLFPSKRKKRKIIPKTNLMKKRRKRIINRYHY